MDARPTEQNMSLHQSKKDFLTIGMNPLDDLKAKR
jgi:hypothetical protein